MISIVIIFVFGCILTGVVMLGIIEAQEQAMRAEAVREYKSAVSKDTKT